MVYVDIDSLNPGDIVGKAIIDNHGNVLLKPGTALTEFHIGYLTDKNYDGIYIQDKRYEEVKIPDEVLSDKVKYTTKCALEHLDIPTILENAKKIVDEIMYKKNISFDNYSPNNDLAEQSIEVATMAVVIGKVKGLKEKELQDLAIAGLLHNVGKCLRNPIKFKELNEKYKLGMKGDSFYKEEHYPQYGFYVLKDIANDTINSKIRLAVLSHNIDEDEKNGFKINDKTIHPNLEAKIIHIASSYIQLKYHESPNEAVEYLYSGSGTKFNSELVSTFLQYIPTFPKGTMVRLSNGLDGVVKRNELNNLRPIIILENGEEIDLMDPKHYNLTIINTTKREKELEKVRRKRQSDEISTMLSNEESKIEPKKML